VTTPQLTKAVIERLQALAGRLRGVRKQSEHLFPGLPLGVTLGYYTAGRAGYGTYVLDALNHRNPEALELFTRWGLFEWLGLSSPPPR
jgi:hypothetical protein